MNNQAINNKVAIVTGSSMGIGKATATALAAQGAKVVLNGRELPKLLKTEAELKAKGADVIAVQADVRYPEECQKLVEAAVDAFGQIDILVNNAAITTRGSVEDMIPSIFTEVMDTNFSGCVFATKCALPFLKESKGHIVFINSIAGFCGIPYNSIYSCSKIAQSHLADALRIELAGTGIHIGIAYVCFTDNDPQKKVLDYQGHWVYLPSRDNVSRVRPQYVASKILNMITQRKPKVIFSKLGKATYYVQRFFPFIVRLIFYFRRKKLRNEYTYIGGEKVA